jgi:16S rRNA (cytosine967-C5)-methyltransferase
LSLNRKVLTAATEALGLVLRFEYPADNVLSRYFQQHHDLGQHDRAFVAESIYGVLRHRRTLEHLVQDVTPRRLLLGWLARFSGSSVRDVTPALSAAEAASMTELKSKPLDDLAPEVRAELPDWVYERLARDTPLEDVLALGRGLQDPAPLDLRVNTLKHDRESVQRILAQSGIDAQPTPYSPIGLRVQGRPALNRHPLFLSGAVEVQDEGSQLVGFLVAPRRHELVVDFCAGAGGKSLMLGAMMGSHGRVYAFDVSPARIARLKPRLKRSGLSNLHPQLLKSENDIKIKRLAGKIDRVLVDAPCSGLGTLRRNPDLKWRQSPQSVIEMRAKQAAILHAAAGLVKKGGRLVYATCSLLAEENEAIVEAFLAAHPEFAPRSAAEILTQQGIGLDTGQWLRLWPHVHRTDGFFAAVLERQI